MRRLVGHYRTIAVCWIIAIALFQLYTGGFGVYQSRIQRAVHLLFLLPAAFLYFPATKKSPKDRFTWLDVTLALLALAPCLFIVLETDRLNLRFEHVTDLLTRELVLGALGIILLVEGVRRAVVPALALIVSIAIVYMLTCEYWPSMLYYRPFTLPEVVEKLVFLTDDGMFGSVTGVSATFVAIFVCFGSFLNGTGVGKVLIQIACKIAGRSRGGPAKIACVSSAFFGSMSGSSTANVYTTGSFTIPMMKSLGYRPEFAGAVEATASTGGMILPPVMGAGAFVMAELTGIPYVSICWSAALGAVMYYLGAILSVHIEAVKYDLPPLPKEQIPTLREIVIKLYLVFPIVGLVYMLVTGFSPSMAAFVAIVLSIGMIALESLVREVWYAHKVLMDSGGQQRYLRPKIRTILWHFVREFYSFLLKSKECLISAGENMIMIALACAGAGMIVSTITNTGLGTTFSGMMIAYSGGILIFALFFASISSLVLGMGVPVTAAYIITVAIGGPGLVQLGGDLLASHLFVYFYSILADVTPPVCIAAYAGAAIAKADPLKTGYEACKLAIAAYFIPYIMFFDHGLLMYGDSALEVVLSALRLLSLLSLVIIAIKGWLLRPIPVWARGIFLLGGIAIAYLLSSKVLGILIGLALLAILVMIQSRSLSRIKEVVVTERSKG